MQAVPYFSSEDVNALVNAEMGDEPEALLVQCPLSGLAINLTHSHFDGRFTAEIVMPGADARFLYTDFSDQMNDDNQAAYVNARVNMIMAGFMAQNPKLDTKTAAFAANSPEVGFAQDFERFQRYLLRYEGFDRDVARHHAYNLANTKWDLYAPAGGEVPFQTEPE